MSEHFADLHKEHSGMYDCIVVGAGVAGLGTAHQLAKQGYKTLLIEQFTLPHSRGSSSGLSRAIRRAHFHDLYYAMVPEMYQMWKELEQESNAILSRNTGVLFICKNSKKSRFLTLRQSMAKHQFSFEDLTTKELENRYSLMSYKGDYSIVNDIEGGVLIANKCLQTLQAEFVRKGGTLHDNEKVVKIEPGRIVSVHTNKGCEYKAGALVLTPGPWASQLLKPLGLDLPLKVWRANVCFFKEKQPGSYKDYPVMFDDLDDGFMYFFPSQDYPGYAKMGIHLLWDEVDPDRRDVHQGTNKPQVDIERVREYIQEHFPGLEPEPSIIETCMYTCTPEEEIIVDTHPVYHNIAFGCGFSGTGFKLGPPIGRILGDLAMGKRPSYDLSPIGMKRFLTQKAKL